MAEHAIQVPVLGVLSDRARADERRRLDPEAGLLRDVDDGIDVGLEGAGGAVGLDRKLGAHDLLSQMECRFLGARAGARETDVVPVHSDSRLEMKGSDLLGDRGIGD